MRRNVFYIDPQSYNNLSVYDHSLLKGIKDWQIHYFCNRKYDFKPLDGAKVHPFFHYSDYRKSWRKVLSYSGSLLRVMASVVRHLPAVVHVQWIHFWPLDYLFVIFLHLLRVKVVFTAHNLLPHVRRRGEGHLYRWYYEQVDAIIVHTQRTQQEMIENLHIDAKKVHVLRHGILDTEVDEVAVSRRVEELRAQLHLPTDAVIFSCLGMQNKYKGIDLVTRVWSHSKVLQGKSCYLLIVGRNVESIDYSEVKALANVHILNDKVSNLDFEAYLRLSSVVLLPYTRISQSGLLFSAIQAGVPVLVSDVGGLTEPLSVAEVGWCIGRPKEETLANVMERLANAPDEVARVWANADAFQRVRKAYDWTEISASTNSLYHSLLQ